MDMVLPHSLFCPGVRGIPERIYPVAKGAVDPLAWCLVVFYY